MAGQDAYAEAVAAGLLADEATGVPVVTGLVIRPREGQLEDLGVGYLVVGPYRPMDQLDRDIVGAEGPEPDDHLDRAGGAQIGGMGAQPVIIRSFPKGVFLYPCLVVSLLCAAIAAFGSDPKEGYSALAGKIFVIVFA